MNLGRRRGLCDPLSSQSSPPSLPQNLAARYNLDNAPSKQPQNQNYRLHWETNMPKIYLTNPKLFSVNFPHLLFLGRSWQWKIPPPWPSSSLWRAPGGRHPGQDPPSSSCLFFSSISPLLLLQSPSESAWKGIWNTICDGGSTAPSSNPYCNSMLFITITT